MPWVDIDDPRAQAISKSAPAAPSTPTGGKWVDADSPEAKAFAPHGLPTGSDATLTRGIPGWAETLEYGGQNALGLGGAAAGMAITPGAEPLGGAAGWGLGTTAGENINAVINKAAFGKDDTATLSRENISPRMKANMEAGAVGEAIGPVAGKLLSGAGRMIVGKAALEDTAREAAQVGDESLKSFEAAKAKATEDADAKFAKDREKIVKDVTPEARQEAVSASVGRTPEEARALAHSAPEVVAGEKGPAALPSTEAIDRRNKAYDAIFGPRGRTKTELDKQYENVYGPFKNKPADVTPLSKVVAAERQFAQENGVNYSPGVQKLLAQAESFGKSDDPLLKFFSQEEINGMSPTQRANYLKSTTPTESPAKVFQFDEGGKPVPKETKKPTLVAPQAPTAKIGVLRGYKSQLGEMISRTGDSPERTALVRLRNAVDESLANANVPGAKLLNDRNRFFHQTLGDDFTKSIRRESEPTQMADEVFDHPQRAQMLIDGATPEERKAMAGMYGDWVSRHGIDQITPEHAQFFGKLFPNSPLSKAPAWVFEKKSVDHLQDLIQSSPQAGAKMQAALKEAKQAAQDENDTALVKTALNESKRLGTVGDRIKKAIDAAPTLDTKAKAAADAFGSHLPEQNAVGALQNFTPHQGRMSGYIMRRAMFAGLGMGPVSLARGNLAPSLVGSGIVAGGLGVREAVAAAYRYAKISSPESATAFYKAVTNPGAPSSLRTIADFAVKGAVADATAHAIKPPEKSAPAAKGPGPMSQAADRKKAEVVAGVRGEVSTPHVDHIEDLSQKIARGDTPDVQNDLKNGRISTAEIRKMVDGNKVGVSAMFDGLSLGDSIDVLAKASPEEKEMALPVLAQRFQNEGGKLPPEQRMAMMNRLKAALGQGAEG